MEKRIPPSARLEQAIASLVEDGKWDPDRLAELGRFGAQLIIQRAVEEEVSTFLGRAHYERSPSARGWRNGVRSRRVQTGEGELVVEVPQVRGTVERFVCRTIPGTRTVVRTRPLEALIIGAYVRGLSDRDLEMCGSLDRLQPNGDHPKLKLRRPAGQDWRRSSVQRSR